ncbi:PaaI family thioesterase [Patulibacter defluvii]|uniref:PaaI family thioesterase n=1 Tax=Patulibacter defluvii TaxID=3095358 RepID=UPI002A75CBCF|nr:PaaI family thioesterase [Patulibacter sp. DM4]
MSTGTDTPSGRELIAAFLQHSPLSRLLGIEPVTIGSDEALLRLPFRHEVTTIADVVHGGAIGALADTAAVAAAWAFDEPPRKPNGATVSLNVDYLRAAAGVDLLATGTVTHRAGRTCFCDVVVRSADEPDGPPVARATAVYRFA